MLSREEADALVASLPTLAGITADSREATRDVAFAAYPGTARDGRAFIVDALARNAAAIVYESHDFTWDDAW
ncbi:MAG TPA: Mur ligase domain-containing protein, partial [Casimicrobiaceae bacterium]|nr:Mur ligase domain-containing protein [Casimicrobiaceae bacterium]